MTYSEIEAMLKKEEEKATGPSLDPKAHYSIELATKPYIQNTRCPNLRTLMDEKGNTREHGVCFLDSIVPPMLIILIFV